MKGPSRNMLGLLVCVALLATVITGCVRIRTPTPTVLTAPPIATLTRPTRQATRTPLLPTPTLRVTTTPPVRLTPVATATPSPSQLASSGLPACQTRSTIQAYSKDHESYWVFIVNFNVVTGTAQGGMVEGCIRAYFAENPSRVLDIPVPCRYSESIIARQGRFEFQSAAEVRCAFPVSLAETINASARSSGPNGFRNARGSLLNLAKAYTYTHFTVELVSGPLVPQGITQTTTLKTAAAVRYDNPVSPIRSASVMEVNANAIATRTTSTAGMESSFNGQRYTTPNIRLNGAPEWSALFVVAPEVWHCFDDPLAQPSPPLQLAQRCARHDPPPAGSPVLFRTDQGSFIVSGARGALLDEVIVDPNGGTKPPAGSGI